MHFSDIDWSLYAILDPACFRNRPLTELTEAIVAGGAGVIQLRDKTGNDRGFYENAVAAKNITDKYGIPLIINDRVDIALLTDAAGVHLGQDDLPFHAARQLLGENKILGASVHSLDELTIAQQGNPDYIGVGTIYSSRTKSGLNHQGVEIVKAIRQISALPVVAIGGITAENLQPVVRAGADGVAVISDLLNSEDVKIRAREIIKNVKLAKDCHDT